MRKKISIIKKRSLLKKYYKGADPKALCAQYHISLGTFYNWKRRYPIKQSNKDPLFVTGAEHRRVVRENDRLHQQLKIVHDYFLYQKLSNKDKYAFMDQVHRQCNLHLLCDAMAIDRGTYYNHLKSQEVYTKTAQRRALISKHIMEIYLHSHRTYGVNRIYYSLQKEGIATTPEYVSARMKEMGIKSIYTERPKDKYRKAWQTRNENSLLRTLHPTAPNQTWVTDITKFSIGSTAKNAKHHGNQITHISIYMDLYSRKILQIDVGHYGSTNLVKKGLIAACRKFHPPKGLVLHTDGGGQYNSWSMQQEYEKRDIRHSQTHPHSPTENGVMESFNKTVKQECLYAANTSFRNRRTLLRRLRKFQDYYNNERIHTSLAGLTPNEFEAKYYDCLAKGLPTPLSHSSPSPSLESDPDAIVTKIV